MKKQQVFKIKIIILTLLLALFFGLAFLIPAKYGLPPSLARPIGLIKAKIYRSISLTRTEPTVKLPASFHRQEHSLSCEIATLKMALSVYGIDVPESELLQYLPFDQTPKKSGVWGDPYQAFVGNIDGKMMVNGYGIYWDPLAYLGLRWKRTEVFYGTIRELTSHLKAGRPIIFWGYLGQGARTSWTTPAGKQIPAVYGMHSRLLFGYTGEDADPSGYFVLDPIYGELFWDRDYFLKQWDTFDRVAVVLYEHPRWVRVRNESTVWEISKDGQTRHALRTTWRDFEKRGGYWEAIRIISPEELESYQIGPAI